MKKLVLVATVFVAACGSNPTIDEFYQQQQQIECDFEFKCCTTVPNAVVYSSVADCEAKMPIDTAGIATLKAAIAAGTLRYNSSEAGSCISSAKSISSSCTNTVASNSLESCGRVISGGVAVGGSCAGQNAGCQDGLYCDDNNVCQKDVGIGQACVTCDSSGNNCNYAECASGAYCDGDTSKMCVATKSNGSSCGDDSQCSSSHCDNSSICNDDDQTVPASQECEINQTNPRPPLSRWAPAAQRRVGLHAGRWN